MSYKTILVAEEKGIRTITLNRPERRNAMTPQMLEELQAAIEEAATGSCRAIVFAGAGPAFCAGLDLSSLQDIHDKSAEEYTQDAERVSRLFRTMYELPKPTIAAVHGAAIAGGAGLATICDFTLAVHGAKFGYTEVKIGFVPALVSAFLTLQIGDKRARDLLLTGRLFSAEEAHRLGLVNEVVVHPEELRARALELARCLTTNSPESMAATKRLLAAQNKAWLDTAIECALTENAKARATHDFREGVGAFLEKRKPVWGK
ncbi:MULTISPECIES: enoyl-CoA hydratase/isomerase family protein [Acidobacteriaceae]|uniref:enoyl-CoA hydratase/isomerase family protein n=1 Tax=Acidobacteriaceae TaxID=204434 RepID=UPI00131CCC3D|nr:MULTISPECIES: enoyl-CoA hydratase/isomerase family protein [Acidobacteriaceae]MDW5264136.1 enoyl-CoA hydratase/isomerase family protein [Edaphobacter sp.]